MNGCDISCLYIDLHPEPLFSWERMGSDALSHGLRAQGRLHLFSVDGASEPSMWAYAKRFATEAPVLLVLLRGAEDAQAVKLAVSKLLGIKRRFVLLALGNEALLRPLKNADLVLAEDLNAVLEALKRQNN